MLDGVALKSDLRRCGVLSTGNRSAQRYMRNGAGAPLEESDPSA